MAAVSGSGQLGVLPLDYGVGGWRTRDRLGGTSRATGCFEGWELSKHCPSPRRADRSTGYC